MSTSRGPRREADEPVAGERRRARERALGLLYEAEMKDLEPGQVLAALPSPPEPYAVELFLGVGRRADELDELVAAQSASWALDRMPAVDRQ
ncbi:MAG TPA: transcription antitermination factor NusB, partial [Acidimicrobiales bacterium]|nr:transcription antitermination factor NusB [Acidimicrobiales bacterium]